MTVTADYSDFDIMVMLSRITNTASGSDDLSIWLYRACATELSHVLSRPKLINFSINKGEVPRAWKQAVITPVPKTTPAVSVSDLRRISVTPVLSRIVERFVVRDFISPFIPSQSLIDQYAYKATGSTTETVGRMLENSLYVRCLLLDFSKAFDRVDRLILLKKLDTYHLPGNILSRIISYLTERSVY